MSRGLSVNLVGPGLDGGRVLDLGYWQWSGGLLYEWSGSGN